MGFVPMLPEFVFRCKAEARRESKSNVVLLDDVHWKVYLALPGWPDRIDA